MFLCVLASATIAVAAQPPAAPGASSAAEARRVMQQVLSAWAVEGSRARDPEATDTLGDVVASLRAARAAGRRIRGILGEPAPSLEVELRETLGGLARLAREEDPRAVFTVEPDLSRARSLRRVLTDHLAPATRVAERLVRSGSRARPPVGGPPAARSDLVAAHRAVVLCSSMAAELVPTLRRALDARSAGVEAVRAIRSALGAAERCAEDLDSAQLALAALGEPALTRVADYRTKLRVLSADVQFVVKLVLLATAADVLAGSDDAGDALTARQP